jgi:hypothetical protein
MRLPNIRVIALLSGLAVAGCGASNISHGGGGTGGTGGGGSGGTGGNGGTGGSGGGGSDNNCGVQNFTLTKGGTPDLLLIQDRSGSMAWSIDGTNMTPPAGQSRWEQITAAIKQVVGQVNSVEWGLLFFGPDTGSCTVPATPQVACGMGTSGAITTAINAASPMGGTPTAEAINAGVQYFMGNTDGNTHYMLLATDGEPSCSLGGNDVQAAEDAVTAANMAGIKTIVVGIGASGADAALTAMANNGGMPNTAPGQKPYYQVNNTADLTTALTNIAGQLVSCSYPLSMAPANPDYVEIDDNNGMKIPRDKTHMNGWDYGPGNLSITFYGPACDNLQKGVTTGISAVFGCPPVG